jgi:hypothetical protein
MLVMHNTYRWCLVWLGLWLWPVVAQDAPDAPPAIYPAAILPFEERGAGMEGQGRNVADILFASLAENPQLYLVDRQELTKLLAEAALSLSGAVDTGKAVQIGQLTGARILITGSVFKAGRNTYVVAKIIGTETSKVLGKSVNGPESAEDLASQLGSVVSELLTAEAKNLVAQVQPPQGRLAALRVKLGDKRLPSALIQVRETHIGRAAIDPAAETELIHYWRELGGEVIDALRGDPKQAAVRIEGEGFSEFAAQVHNLVSVKARLEVRVLDKDGKVLAIDRQTTVRVDLNEMGAGKLALQDAAAAIAERLIPKLAE